MAILMENTDPDFGRDELYDRLLRDWRGGRIADDRDRDVLLFLAWRHGDKDTIRALCLRGGLSP